jgi:hypothetical protein
MKPKNQVCVRCSHPRRLHVVGFRMKQCFGAKRVGRCSCEGFTLRDLLAPKKPSKKLRVKAMLSEMSTTKK